VSDGSWPQSTSATKVSGPRPSGCRGQAMPEEAHGAPAAPEPPALLPQPRCSHGADQPGISQPDRHASRPAAQARPSAGRDRCADRDLVDVSGGSPGFL